VKCCAEIPTRSVNGLSNTPLEFNSL
jgi:hypothetical protein